MIGIYKITSPTGKVYVGQSINIKQRFNSYLKYNAPGQPMLNNSFKKHGVKNHIFEVIEECSVDQLNSRERFFQEKYNAINPKKGMNCKYTQADDKKQITSKLTLSKMSKSHSGKNNQMYGKTHSEEAREKISKTHKGRKLTQEHIDKLKKNCARPWFGKKRSEEMKKKISEYRTGRPMPEDVKERIKKTMTGKVFTDLHKKRIGAAHVGKKRPMKTRKKLMKPVIDLCTGIVFDSAHEAAKCFNIRYKNLIYHLQRDNHYSLRYLFKERYEKETLYSRTI